MVGTFAEFQETMALTLPDIRGRVEDVFGEANKTSSSHGLIVEVAAIHEGLTSNFNFYTAEELEAALDSWVNPYPKPILINHNLEVDPLGRVMAAKMDKEKDGSFYTRLQIAVTDPSAMARVSDQRYLTGSVGGKSKVALCSVCGTDWAEASPVSLPCKHTRGKTYKGKLAFLERRELGFKEYSFVNAPADSLSGIRASDDTGEDENENEWVRSARIFDLNMNKQEIMEFGESENRSVLGSLRRKEATPMYLQLKGAFLTALSAQAAELGIDEESSEMNEDILALSEELSEDLTMVAEGPEDSEDNDSDAEIIDGQSDGDDEPQDESTQDDDEVADEDKEPIEPEGEEEATSAEEPESHENETGSGPGGGQEDSVDEANFDPDDQRGLPRNPKKEGRAQGMEVPRLKHDSNTYGFNPMTGDGGTQRRGIETVRKDPTRESEDLEGVGEETELNEATSTLERRVSELEERESALLEENTRLKRALHRTLVERVVDGKITLGLYEVAERETMLNEHMTRSAGSLADNLRDLAKMTFKRSFDPTALPTLEQKSLVTAKDKANALEATITESEEEPEIDPESIFVDALMGRRKL